MAKFERPQGTILDAKELNKGDVVWSVYGIFPPCVNGPYVVTRAVMLFKNHPEYRDIHHEQAACVVFDTQPVRGNYSHMNYALDGNMEPGQSRNDNYWFRSKDEAVAAAKFLLEKWKANPEMIEKEMAWQRALRD